MTHPTLQSKATTKRITVKRNYSLEQYKEIVYLTKDYYNALKKDLPLPNKPLPKLQTLLDAAQVVDAYLKASNVGLSLKLYNATLDAKDIVAVWLFANDNTTNIKLGRFQLLSLKHY